MYRKKGKKKVVVKYCYSYRFYYSTGERLFRKTTEFMWKYLINYIKNYQDFLITEFWLELSWFFALDQSYEKLHSKSHHFGNLDHHQWNKSIVLLLPKNVRSGCSMKYCSHYQVIIEQLIWFHHDTSLGIVRFDSSWSADPIIVIKLTLNVV